MIKSVELRAQKPECAAGHRTAYAGRLYRGAGRAA